MNVMNLSKAVRAALARLNALEQSPMSLTKEEELSAVQSELRQLRKLACDKINALPWGDEKKQVMSLRDELDRALSNWEYEFELDISEKRVNALKEELLANGLNNSKRKKLQKELRRIFALRQRLVKEANATTPAVTKSLTEQIAEYQARRARLLGSEKKLNVDTTQRSAFSRSLAPD